MRGPALLTMVCIVGGRKPDCLQNGRLRRVDIHDAARSVSGYAIAQPGMGRFRIKRRPVVKIGGHSAF